MEGIYSLLWVVLAGAVAAGFILGLVLPGRRRLAMAIVALLAFAAMAAEHVRLNGQPGDPTPFALYAMLAALAALPGLLGIMLAASLRRRG